MKPDFGTGRKDHPYTSNAFDMASVQAITEDNKCCWICICPHGIEEVARIYYMSIDSAVNVKSSCVAFTGAV